MKGKTMEEKFMDIIKPYIDEDDYVQCTKNELWKKATETALKTKIRMINKNNIPVDSEFLSTADILFKRAGSSLKEYLKEDVHIILETQKEAVKSLNDKNKIQEQKEYELNYREMVID